MAKILVTGGAGFVGRAICKALLARGDDAVAMVLNGEPGLETLSYDIPGIQTVHANIVDADQVERAFTDHTPDAVIHCAAVVGVLVSLDDPTSVFRVNIDGSVNLMQAMIRHGVNRVIHISSEEVYGAFNNDRVDWDDEDRSRGAGHGHDKHRHGHGCDEHETFHGLEVLPKFFPGTLGCRLHRAPQGRPQLHDGFRSPTRSVPRE